MPAVAAIAPAPPATPAAASTATAAAGKAAPFQLELGDTAQDAAQAATSAPAPRPPSAKAQDKPDTASAQPGPPAWLVAMLGGAAAPVQGAAAAQPAPAADDGMPAAPAASGNIAVAAKPDAKAGGAVQPLPLAAGPASGAAAPSETKDADAGEADDAAPGLAAPLAAPPAAAHEPPPARAAVAATPAAPPPTHSQTFADAATNFQAFARVLDTAGSDSAAPSATAPAPHASLNTGHAEWPQALADQVQWQLGHEVQEARLELHPRDLGTVQVQVRITSEGAEVRFAATHPQAREALQAALPQLRSLLQGDGIALAQSQVGAQSSWQAPAQQQRQPQAERDAAAASNADEEPAAAAPRVVRIGLVDDFA